MKLRALPLRIRVLPIFFALANLQFLLWWLVCGPANIKIVDSITRQRHFSVFIALARGFTTDKCSRRWAPFPFNTPRFCNNVEWRRTSAVCHFSPLWNFKTLMASKRATDSRRIHKIKSARDAHAIAAQLNVCVFSGAELDFYWLNECKPLQSSGLLRAPPILCRRSFAIFILGVFVVKNIILYCRQRFFVMRKELGTYITPGYCINK